VFFYLSKPSLFTPKAYFLAFQGERKEEEMKMISFFPDYTPSVLKRQ
jgi:hypothetical protein